MMARVLEFPTDRIRAKRLVTEEGRELAEVIPIEAGKLGAKALYDRASAIDEEQAMRLHAKRLYREALKQDPGMHFAMTNLANLFWKEGEIREARALWTRALMHDPAQPEALCNMGYSFAEENRHATAVQYYEEALKHDPGFADCWYNLGMSLERVKKLKKAKEAFKRFLALEPNSVWSDVARRHL